MGDFASLTSLQAPHTGASLPVCFPRWGNGFLRCSSGLESRTAAPFLHDHAASWIPAQLPSTKNPRLASQALTSSHTGEWFPHFLSLIVMVIASRACSSEVRWARGQGSDRPLQPNAPVARRAARLHLRLGEVALELLLFFFFAENCWCSNFSFFFFRCHLCSPAVSRIFATADDDAPPQSVRAAAESAVVRHVPAVPLESK